MDEIPEPPNEEFVKLVRKELLEARSRALETMHPASNLRNRLGSGKMSEKDIHDAYALYQEGFSFRELARMLWEKHGYKSEISCQNSLRCAFRARGLKSRSVGAAMIQSHRRRRLSATTEKAVARHY